MLTMISIICLIFFFVFAGVCLCSTSNTIATISGILAVIFVIATIMFAIIDGKESDKDTYTSVTISDKQGNLRHSYSGNIHYKGGDRLKIIDKEGNTIYYTIDDDEIFYGVH